ncbi:MAG TPA: long-chain fatty acid--CoA ligase [Bacteroidales bacterium]|nr:MAG: AMP-dependent synthetase [Bacteroidetes bacterium GWF2_33_38]OFY72339.1 MAG: AMP-dependent synthetase [Bacteroidetes bacterium RIFOXYA12_FULL_33_9]HBF88244.1 long-chain fatty acid--CoA ligase [Bacteroidales bacterium]
MKVQKITDLLENYKQNYPNKEDAFAGKAKGKWYKYSTKDFLEMVDAFSCGLLELGFYKGDKIATLSNNRPEWNVFDHGIMQNALVHVPIYPTLGVDDYKYILEHSEVKAVIISDKAIYSKLIPVISEISTIKFVFSIDEIENVRNWSEILELGRKFKDKYIKKVRDINNSIKPNDLATLIYTSGTTGVPKGVMLSHSNIVSNFVATTDIQPMTSVDRALSFLPLCHVYERMMNYQYQYKGISIYYAENMGTIANDIKEVKPHGFNTVPRLLEKVYDKIIATGKDLPSIKKKMFFGALNLGLKYDIDGNNGRWYDIQLWLAQKLVLVKWRKALGGNLKLIVSGGAALQPRLERIFWAAGIKLVEGYGLTETSPVIAVNYPHKPDIKFGTVGLVLKGVSVKIADDGEILCKGDGVMLGYYKNQEATNEVIDADGWFHTGDIGVFEDERFLKITDRKKEIFKLSSGKYISPQVIENKFKESNFIEQIMVIGENEKFASALISPNFDYLHFWGAKHKIHYRENSLLVKDSNVIARIQKEVSAYNKTLGQFEQIKRFRLVCEEWTPASGDLSPTLKLRRKIISEKYKHIIQEIYRSGDEE